VQNINVLSVLRAQADWPFIFPSELYAIERRHGLSKMPLRGEKSGKPAAAFFSASGAALPYEFPTVK
jgi:hypothetical protein